MEIVKYRTLGLLTYKTDLELMWSFETRWDQEAQAKTMKTVVILCLAVVVVYAQDVLEVAEDEAGEQYVLVPLKRLRR